MSGVSEWSEQDGGTHRRELWVSRRMARRGCGGEIGDECWDRESRK